MWWRAWLLVLGVVMASACADVVPGTAAPRVAWACPPGWVAAEAGGCGPSVLLCRPGGGAVTGVCPGGDVEPPPLSARDGGVVRGFRRLPDGGIGGAWPEPGDPDGPPDVAWTPAGVPAEDYVPAALVAACTDGWQRAPDGACSPALRTDCPEGSRALPGGSCTHTARADCPSGDYPDPGAEAVGMPRVHVRAGADAALADGSAEHPYASVGEGVARGGADAWVLVAEGEYRERVTIARGEGRHVLGLCAARTVILGPGPAALGGETFVVRGPGTSLDLRGVTVTGEGRGLAVGGGAALRLTRVAVVANREHGVIAGAVGTRLDVTDSVVRGTQPSAAGTESYGITAQGGAQVTMQAAAVVENVGVGLMAREVHTAVELRGVSVQGQTTSRSAPGLGLEVDDRAELQVERSVIAGNAGAGAVATTGATLRVEGALVRANGAWGVGAHTGASVTVQATRLTANVSGVVADGSGSELTLSESVVRDSVGIAPTETAPGRLGHGVDALDHATIRVLGSVIAHNVEAGMLATGAGTRLDVQGSVVRETTPRARSHGEGIQATTGATVSVLRSRVVGNTANGVAALDGGTVIELRHSVIERTRPADVGVAARGLVATGQATLRATGVVVADNSSSGVLSLGAGTHVELDESVVRGTRPVAPSQLAVGLAAVQGAALGARRVVVADNTAAGLRALDPGTAVVLERSVIRGPSEAAGGARGHGVEVSDEARLQASGVVIEGCAGTGIFTAASGTRVDLTGSVVRETRSDGAGAFGDGIQVTSGSVLRADGVLVQNSRRVGLAVFDADTRLLGADVIVLRVDPNAAGLGVGVYAAARGSVLLQRLAVVETAGTAIAAVPFQEPERLWDDSRVTVTDLYVRQVATSPVRLALASGESSASTALVAHGLYVGPMCAIRADRAVLDGGGYGLFNTHGSLQVNQAVIRGQRDGAGANDDGTPAASTTLIGVVRRGNANDAVVQILRPQGRAAPLLLPSLVRPPRVLL